MSHSKRNTSRPVFTAHERALAKNNWSSTTARLHRDSFLPFGSCGLCLEIARDPVSCGKGDIFCRECALANILAQKQELKREEKRKKGEQRERVAAEEGRDEEERRRAVKDFEMTQAGLDVAPSNSTSRLSRAPTMRAAEPSTTNSTTTGTELVLAREGAGIKRKFELDQDEVERTARADKTRARKAIDDEKANKAILPSFWTPSLTPDVKDTNIGPAKTKEKTSPTCPASKLDHTHPFTLHKLISIDFTEEIDETTKDKRRTCPSCRKVLSNASAPVMAKGCGHVLCQKCLNQFLIASDDGKKKNNKKKATAKEETDGPVEEEIGAIIHCFVCDKPIAATSGDESSKHRLPVGLVALKSEGTGFSARGTSTVEKSTTSFQC